MKQKSRSTQYDTGESGGARHYTNHSGGQPFPNYLYTISELGAVELHSAGKAEATTTIQASSHLQEYVGTEKIAWGTNPRPAFNHCQHFYTKSVDYPYTVIGDWEWPDYTDPNYLYLFWYHRRRCDPGPMQLMPSYPEQDGGGNFSSRAWWSMQPRFEGKLQALNALYELKDFRDVAKGMRSLFRPGSRARLRREFGAALNPTTKFSKRSPGSAGTGFGLKPSDFDPTVPAASGLLTYNMAIVPLVSDFLALMASLATTVAKAQDIFTELGENKQSSHYTEVLDAYDESTSITRNEYHPVPWDIRSGVGVTVKRTATLEYTYKYRRRSASEAFLKYWGLLPSGEVIWNAIPLSFLLDYFWGISDSFAAMDIDPRVDVLPTQYCESRSIKQVQGLYFVPHSATHCIVVNGIYYPNNGISQTLINGYESSYYERRVCSPNKGLYVPIKKSMTPAHQLNMAALARMFF